MGDNDAKQLKPLDGKKVHVEGVPFAEYTAWHVRPVVLSLKSVTTR